MIVHTRGLRSTLLLGGVLLALGVRPQASARFVENKGQWPGQVRYMAEVSGAAVWCEGDGLLVDRYDATEVHQAHAHARSVGAGRPVIRHHAMRLRFLGATTDGVLRGDQRLVGTHNYFLGSDPTKWGSNAHAFGIVEWREVVPGVRLRLTTTANGLKYDLHLAPGADPGAILLRYEGVDGISLRDDHLLLETSLGPVVERIPLAYQERNGKRVPVACTYTLTNGVIGFRLGRFDPAIELVIDPTLEFSTYSGSTTDNFGYTASFDEQGFLYSGSSSFGSGYPTTTGAYQVTWNGGDGQGNIPGTDIAISKYDTTGTFMVWSTMLGGQGDDLPHSLVVNANNEVYVLGTTGSSDFPVTAGALDGTFGGGQPYTPQGIGVSYPNGSDMIVAKLSNDGTELLSSTFLGGSQNDGHNSAPALKFNYADEMRGEILLDANDQVFVLSCTGSTDFPVSPGAPQAAFAGGTHDGVLVKLNASLTSLVWSTFFGGTGADAVFGGELFANGDLAFSGGTVSNDLPVPPSAYQVLFQGGQADAFAGRINAAGTAITGATYYGSGAYDQAYFIDLDDQENIFLFGQTQAPAGELIFNAPYNIPTAGQFIAKLSPDATSLLMASRFGAPTGSPTISPTAFLVDYCDKLYVSGWGSNIGIGPPLTTNGLPITPDAFQSTTDGHDFYLAVFEVDMSALSYATFFGGSISHEHVDGGTSRFDRRGRVYQSVCAGCGSNSDFPIEPNPGAVSPTNNSPNCNNAVFKFDFDAPLVVAAADAPDTVCADAPVQFSNYSNGVSYLWEFGDGDSSTLTAPQHTYQTTGNFIVTLTAFDPASCNGEDQISFSVTVLGAAPALEAMNDTLYCGPIASFTLTASGTGDVNAWQWSSDDEFSDMLNSSPSDSTALIQPAVSGTWYVQGSTSGCASVDSVVIEVSLANIAISPDQEICADETAQLQLSGVDPGSTIVWTPSSEV
ncbi:MAG: PKD domain-containing protein, partial [Flavobacteriales bacterium]|nr:PKD domain-containing protein [Flavobacteriales bacterium]